MNNPYQNRPPQILNQPPHHFEHRGPHIQPPLQEKPNPQYHYPHIAVSNQPAPAANHQVTTLSSQAQLFHQYANSNNHQPQPIAYQPANQMYFPPPHPQILQNGLIPPPQLRQEQDHDDTIDNQRGSNIVKQENSKSNGDDNELQVRDILWGEQEQANVFWEQKFFLIYEKFEWFGSRFEMLKSEYISLSEQLLSVDSEDDWNELKRQHEEFAEKLEEMFQELIAVADENQQLINQRLQEDDGVWQKRYHELLSNFKALQEKTSMLQGENQDLKVYQQNGNQQQQENYPELLSHYRNLEEEYEKLYTAYNKLQEEYEIVKSSPNNGNGPSLEDFENMRMEYQRTLEAIQGENDQLKGDCQGFYEENEHLKEQLQHHSHAYGETEQLAKALHEKDEIAMNLSNQLQEWKRNYQQLEHQLNELVQRQSAKAQEIIIQLESQLNSAKIELSAKDSQYTIVSKKLEDELRTREQLIHDHHDEMSKAVKLEADKHLRQKQTLEKEVKTLHQEYEALLKQSSEKDINKYQVESQEKRMAFIKQENEQLIEEIRVKNVELSTLRNVSLQLATYENILEQYKSLEKEKLSLEEISRREHSELLQTRKRFNELEHEFSQFKALTASSSVKSTSSSQLKYLQQELSAQKEQASKLHSESQKFRQLLEAKEKYIHQLEEENTKNIIKIEHQSRLVENSQHQHSVQVQMLERRIDTLEKRNRANELEFRTEVVQNYEREIRQLRQGNEEKQKKVKKLEESLNQFVARSSHLERFSSSHNGEMSLLQNKLTTLEVNNNDLLSKLSLARQSIESLEKQLTSVKDKETVLRTQINSFTIQIEEADSLIINKNNIIVDLEGQLKAFDEKVASLEARVEAERKEKLEKVKRYEQEMDKLRERLYSNNGNSQQKTDSRRDSLSHQRYSSSYSNRFLSFGPKTVEPQKNEQISKIQTTLIEQMNEQNAKLRQEVLELTKKVNSLESLSRVVANNLENSPTKSHQKSRIGIQNANQVPEKDVGVGSYLEERLLRFNERLQNCIQDNNLITVRDVDLTASQRIANHEREKREMEVSYEKQIKALKERIVSLEEQLNNRPATVQGQLMDSDIKEFDKYEILNEQAQKSAAESLQFLRSKLTQQQKTNSVLIKLNEELKRQLEESFQKSSQSTSQYYKLQWRESERFLQEERQKNKKLSDDNKRLSRENLQHDTKLMKEYELKVFTIEQRLKQVERENSYFKLQRAKSENEKANLMHDVHVYSADIETIKSSSENKVVQYERVVQELKEKCLVLERELYEGGARGIGSSNNSASRLGSGEKRVVAA